VLRNGVDERNRSFQPGGSSSRRFVPALCCTLHRVDNRVAETRQVVTREILCTDETPARKVRSRCNTRGRVMEKMGDT